MLGLQLGDEVSAFQKLLQLLQITEDTHALIYNCRNAQSSKRVNSDDAAEKSPKIITNTDRKVKLLRLLLIGPSFGQAGLAEIGLAESGLDRLHAVAVVKALRDVVVLYCHHVLDGGQGGLHGFLHLMGSKRAKKHETKLINI